jgi:hypothetical protein
MKMSEEIQVDVDPMTAFTAFTDEFDQWWGMGPIDAMETWRITERRIEPGVGGRLLDVYGDEELVNGTITIWEPGARLAWTTRNDVTIDVEFEALASGTRVRVTGTVPDGVDGTSALAPVRMTPRWFPRYLRRRGVDRAPYGRLHLGLRSATPAATARWLVDVFQLEPAADVPLEEGDPDYTWIELRVGSSFIVLWGGGGTVGTDSPFVYVDDLDAHLAHAQSKGATIVSPIVEHGFRGYVAADCEGRHWQFAQSGPRLGR